MKFSFVFTLIFIATFSSFALALEGGTTAGNGGHGVLCDQKWRDSRNFRLELLDLFEARRLYPKDFAPAEPIKGPADRIKDSEGVRLRRHLSDAIYMLVAELGSTHEIIQRIISIPESKFEAPDEIGETDDYWPLLTELGPYCKIVQLALNTTTDRERVVADRFYTSALPDMDLAALFIHERLHGYFNSEDTRAVRQFVTWTFASPEFRDRNRHLFFKLIRTRRSLSANYL